MKKNTPPPAHSNSTTACYQKPKLDLFAPITPYSSGFLSVDDLHTLYWEQSGNPDGVPILLLHGGPGAGATPTHRRFFDPDFYRIIIFDQRGAGRSTPLGALKNNTTDLLVEDIEKLRTHLSIRKWHIFGGSWGSTLALRYAIRYPQHCVSMILRGIFLCEKPEIDWFLYGMGNVFPEAWEQFTDIIPEAERSDLLGAYYKRLTEGDEKAQIEAAICWSLYESACSSIIPNYETITTEEQKQHALSMAQIEAHYFLHETKDGAASILNHIDAIRHIPATIIHGRYDMICAIKSAYKLHQLWPEADYIAVPDAGHSSLDPALRSRLIEATESAKTIRI
ncbi:MAG: prolyl aminopeptidase [Alphaproteobacteria bacterium]